MAIRHSYASINVVQAAEQRIINVFRNGLTVYMSFSGGKDSLCLSDMIYRLIREGKINPSQLIVQFIDEEAIFPCIEETVKTWRKRFLLTGAKFDWYCIEVRHFNCFIAPPIKHCLKDAGRNRKYQGAKVQTGYRPSNFCNAEIFYLCQVFMARFSWGSNNALLNDESFICWDSTRQDVWVRNPPSFAIRQHPLLRPRKDTYQDFLPRVSMDGITITGVRAAESIQRLKYMSKMKMSGKNITGKLQIFPIYDWSDKDVWLYLKEHNVEIPEIYLYLWQIGTSKRALRVSQFFSIDTAKSLVRMNEYYPDLMERIICREPNAYLAALYWDSEMFGRSSRKRKELEGTTKEVDYKGKLLHMFSNFDTYFDTSHKRKVAKEYKHFFVKSGAIATQRDYKEIYEGLISGDPKLRTFRALYQRVYGRYIDQAKKDRANGGKSNG